MTSPPRIAIVATLLALASFGVEEGLAQVDVLPGQRIRATMTNGGLVTGTVVSVTPDSLAINTGMAAFGGSRILNPTMTVTPGASNVKIPIERIAMIEISQGWVSGLKKGAICGGLGGAGLGLIAGAASYDTGATFGGGCKVGCVFGLTILSGAVGALNGLWVGHVWLSGETWIVQWGGLGGSTASAVSPGLSVGLRLPAR